MTKVVELKLGIGSLETGFPVVTGKIFTENHQLFCDLPSAKLPPQPELKTLYETWQLMYSTRKGVRINKDKAKPKMTNVPAPEEVEQICQELVTKINIWFNDPDFRQLAEQIRTKLQTNEEIRFIFVTDNEDIRRLPLNCWQFFQDFEKAEIALSLEGYKQPSLDLFQIDQIRKNRTKTRILVILGSDNDLNLEPDIKSLTGLQNQAEIQWLSKPERETLAKYLEDKQGWDILFFSGHSCSQKEKGFIEINPHDSLPIEHLKCSLKKSIENGLYLAIFNL
jgi:hypothetical protein